MSVRRSMLKSKLHRAIVTHADKDYVGSLALDREMLEAADIIPFEEVHVWNVTRGSRLRTYAMAGPAGSGVVCINGAAAHLARPGDKVIIATFTQVDDDAASHHRPRIVLLGQDNRIHDGQATEIAGPSQRMPVEEAR